MASIQGCINPRRVVTYDGKEYLTNCLTYRARYCAYCNRVRGNDILAMLEDGMKQVRPGVDRIYFFTTTLPSFGVVHRGPVKPTVWRYSQRPAPEYDRCWCGCVHGEDDPVVGTPLSWMTYDYVGQIRANRAASHLYEATWRAIARYLDVKEGELPRAHVVQWQMRGAVHYHGFIVVKNVSSYTLEDYIDKDGRRRCRSLENVILATAVQDPVTKQRKAHRWDGALVEAIESADDARRLRGYLTNAMRYTTRDLMGDGKAPLEFAKGQRERFYRLLQGIDLELKQYEGRIPDQELIDSINENHSAVMVTRKRLRQKREFGFRGASFGKSMSWSRVNLTSRRQERIAYAREHAAQESPVDESAEAKKEREQRRVEQLSTLKQRENTIKADIARMKAERDEDARRRLKK